MRTFPQSIALILLAAAGCAGEERLVVDLGRPFETVFAGVKPKSIQREVWGTRNLLVYEFPRRSPADLKAEIGGQLATLGFMPNENPPANIEWEFSKGYEKKVETKYRITVAKLGKGSRLEARSIFPTK